MVTYCAACMGALGGLVGLVIGLISYPPTAWFAVLEIGIPAAIVGALVGALLGSLALALRSSGRRRTQEKGR